VVLPHNLCVDLRCLCEWSLSDDVGAKKKNEVAFLNVCTSHNEIKLLWLSLHWESGFSLQDKKALSVDCEPLALTWTKTLKGAGLWLT